METIPHDGRETAYRHTAYGDGPPIIYIHGSGGRHNVWVEQYAPSGVGPAAAVDLSGHGESDDIETDPGLETLDAYADDVRAVAREVWDDDEPRVLAGNSMGGAVALWVALERNIPLDGLVLTGTGAKLGVADELLDALDRDFDAALERLHAPNTLFHDTDEEMKERSVSMMRAAGKRVTTRDFRTCDRYDVRDRLGEVNIPALAITGEHDSLTPPSFHEYLEKELPNGECELITDAAHLSFLERPEAWNRVVQEFVRRV